MVEVGTAEVFHANRSGGNPNLPQAGG